MNYKQLSALSAKTYLIPQNFITEFDVLPEHLNSGYAQKQYQRGLEVGKEYSLIVIGPQSVWSGHEPYNKQSSYIESWEGIGYHACTANLLQGFLDSPARIVVHRYSRKSTTLKRASQNSKSS